LSSSDHLGPSISPPLTLGFPAGLFLVHQSDDFFWMLAQRANVPNEPRALAIGGASAPFGCYAVSCFA